VALSADPKAAPLDKALERKVRRLRVLDLLPASRRAQRKKRRRQKLTDYVHELAVADSDFGMLQLRRVDCESHADHTCVAVIGDPCAVNVPADTDCEGPYLTVVVDLSHEKAVLDRALGGGGPVATLEEIEQQVQEAP
jgi:hypothetical protein